MYHFTQKIALFRHFKFFKSCKLLPTTYFRTFQTDISSISLPNKLNFPFYHDVHELCEIAAKEIQDFLDQNTINHNFGLDATKNDQPIGKMFGVLIVQKNDTIGYLAAYSGKLANSNEIAFFVPPVFDMLSQDGYFLKEELKLNAINASIDHLENNNSYLQLKNDLIDLQIEAKTAIANLKDELKSNKKDRDIKRKEIQHDQDQNIAKEIEADLVRQSLRDKHLLRTLTESYKIREDQLLLQISTFDSEILKLKEERKNKSNALQNWLFTNYTFLNASNETKSLLDIFKNSLHQLPPAGAGECCAPKLFQHAFLHNYKPIALAEFWWGASPKSEVRKHKQFYPSCWGKCEPILGHMLKGLQVEENPFLKNPALGKELPIVYDDEYIVVVNKPAEFLSVPGIHISDSVYERIKNRYPNATGPLIVHRLDMSTSGIMVLAKNKDVHENIQKQFIKRKVHKTYIALLDGNVTTTKGKIELPLRVDLDDRPRQMVCYEYGKNAITEFEVLKVENNKTRIQYHPITGRTHQLRVHSAHSLGLNAAIVGDDLYGKKANRLHLHANKLSFYHPISKEWITFEVAPDF